MKLFGSYTSPYVRRIRIIAMELGIPFTFIDTMTDAGQKELREKSPLWKVPYMEMDGETIWDSHTITDYLFQKSGTGPFRGGELSSRWRDANLHTAIDQALDNAILLFYLHKEGIPSDSAPYLQKNALRISSILDYLKRELKENYFTTEKKLGLSELALYTSLDWMRFRAVLPVEEDPIFKSFLAEHGARESFQKTAPPG
ncbi:glutathione S-transferase N-terminal domain-containing protein [Leptospira sp. 96542]|nr:glutathione S-transferase N-terminal domain-containing protein [Leptospira sp. 96542]